MTSITETVRSTAQGTAKTESADKTSAETIDAVSPERVDTSQVREAGHSEVQLSEVQLSDEVANTIEVAEFDSAKVEALRLAIMDGNYPLDAKRIAENMLNLERLIG